MVGCGASTIPPAEPEEQGQTPQRGGSFQMVSNRGLSHLHPVNQPGSNAGSYLTGGVYEQLVDWEYKAEEDWRFASKIAPEIAERWEQPDPAMYVFQIRKGVKWHDGQSLTGRDVAWSYQYIADPANKLPAGINLKAMESITAVDDYTVRLKLKEPDVDFLKKLTNQSRLSILPKHVHERGDSFEKVAIGSGPFKLESFQPDRDVVYSPNREYWKADRPYLDRWRMLAPADEAGRTAAFFAGQNDVLKVAARPQVDAVLTQNKQARLSIFVQENNVEMWLKLNKPPFIDQRVRQAVHLAVDRQAMVSTLTAGDGLVNPPGINALYRAWALPAALVEGMPGWRTPKEQDLARAKQLLIEAGHGQGLSFTIKIDRNNPNWPQVAEMISAQLRPIGVDAKLQPLESGVLAKAFIDGDYDAIVESSSSVGDWPNRLHSRGVENTMPIRDAELDRLIEAQAREFDETKRALVIRDIQQLLLRQAYTIPTITFPGYLLQQPWVHGFVDNGGALPNNNDWGQLWVNQGQLPGNR